MRNLTLFLIIFLNSWVPFVGPGLAAPYLEINGRCDDASTNGRNRYPVIGWNGSDRSAHSTRVYDFQIECNGRRLHLIDLFLRKDRTEKFQKGRGALNEHVRDRWESVKVRDRECTITYVDDWCERSRNELYAICRGYIPCEIENSAYRCQRAKEDCRSARYENRVVPEWEPFPTGYAPLPPGARIIDIEAPRQQTRLSNRSDPSLRQSDSNWQLSNTIIALFLFGAAGGAIYLVREIAPLRRRIKATKVELLDEFHRSGIPVALDWDDGSPLFFSKNAHEVELFRLRAVLSKLRDCIGLYARTRDFAAQLRSRAEKAGRPDLIESIDDFLQSLENRNLLQLLAEERWDDFVRLLNDIRDGFDKVEAELNESNRKEGTRQQRSRQSNQGHRTDRERTEQQKGYQRQEKRQQETPKPQPSEKERAYSVLGLRETATYAQVKKQYRAMSKDWHHDHAKNASDLKRRESKMKEINNARDWIKAHRKGQK